MNQNKNKCLSEGQKRIEKYIFSLKKTLGKGSYATVYLGRTYADDTPVAVKVIDKKIFTNQYNVKNFQLEIEIMKKVKHANIVQLLDVYQTSNNMYLVTEICEGGDLRTYLKKKTKLPEAEALTLLKQILDGFQHLHEHGIIHRDLKPANILLSQGHCKISDFGFARNLEFGENTILRSIVGTPLYMSPQILNHQSYTNKSDLWSVGLIYYEMLHGFTPWPANNELQLINNIKSKSVPFDMSISDTSKDFIKSCLRIREEERMSWEEAFEHPLIADERIPLRKLRSEENSNRQYQSRSKSKSNNRRKNGLSRTPKAQQRTPMRKFSPWKM